ncbi:MAG: hypothetical protein ACM358_07700 [Gemmatimonadota bacterium]
MSIIALTLATGVSAAQAHEHRGFWIGFGLGGGVNLNDGLDGERLSGGTGYLRLGGTPSQRVLLGFEGNFWGRDQDGATIARGNGTFTTMFYPSTQGGGFLKGGIGWASISRATTVGNSTTTTAEGGFGLTAGAGWDVKIGRNIYLTPNADVLFQWFDAKNDPVLGPIPGNNTILMVTMGLTWH